jgi:cardiolipin synthase
MTVANLITTVRIILTPIFIIYLIDEQFLPALVVFVLCGVSDGLDGMVARLFNQKSRLGTFMDPLADKILLVAAFVALGVSGFLPAWLTVMVITRDVMIVLGILVVFLNRMEINITPSIWSKITTCLQFFSVIAVLSRAYVGLPSPFYLYLFYLTGLFTIISGLHYMHYWFRMMGEVSGPGKGEEQGGQGKFINKDPS